MPVIVVEEHCPVTRASRSTSRIFDTMCAHKATSTIGARALLAFTFQPVCGCATRFQRAPKGPRTKVPLEAACLRGTGLGPSIRPMEFIGSDWMDLLTECGGPHRARNCSGTTRAILADANPPVCKQWVCAVQNYLCDVRDVCDIGC